MRTSRNGADRVSSESSTSTRRAWGCGIRMVYAFIGRRSLARLTRQKPLDLIFVGRVRRELEVGRVLGPRLGILPEKYVDHPHPAVRAGQGRIQLERRLEGGLCGPGIERPQGPVALDRLGLRCGAVAATGGPHPPLSA